MTVVRMPKDKKPDRCPNCHGNIFDIEDGFWYCVLCTVYIVDNSVVKLHMPRRKEFELNEVRSRRHRDWRNESSEA